MVFLCSRADNDLFFSNSRFIFCGVRGSLCLSILSHPLFYQSLDISYVVLRYLHILYEYQD